ncbi:MAG TPA: FAD-linked oxidase C-terminal domain-containing protein [Anaerolineales bacterium]|nr:FAD-linked oxidase C-terminal domain-containing protein [Anaerolineales bacterium]
MKNSPHNDLEKTLRSAITGEVRFDETTRLLYSTDASIYQIEPLGVAFPHNLEELSACVEISTRQGNPVLARGSGSSLAGQAIGPALILDCSRYLSRIIEINPDEKTATVEPGVILDDLNRAAGVYGLQFGPDPASSERATMGGVLANNATGAHSIRYGMAADHLQSVDVLLSDGSPARFEAIPEEQAYLRARSGEPENVLSRESALYRAALHIREEYKEAIQRKWPRTWRRASGYNLNYLLPWSSSQPPQWGEWLYEQNRAETDVYNAPYPPVREGWLNLAPILAGSEGTLAVIQRATVNLVPLEMQRVLCVLAYPSVPAACEEVPRLLDHHPAAIELIPESLIRLARSLPAYAHLLSFVDQLSPIAGSLPAAMLAVEFAGNDTESLRSKVGRISQGRIAPHVAWSAEEQQRVWAVRKVGLAILMSRAGDMKPLAFVEDLSVPVEHLGEFVREMERVLAEFQTEGDFYAHASAGCLHIRPLVNLKSEDGVRNMRGIAEAAVSLVIRLGGSVSGEHGDGLARSEWMERLYGPEIMAAFRELKQAADPQNLLNPGKILDAPRMDANLRYGAGYRAQAWAPVMDFSSQAGLTGAVEQCNGAGVCRKREGVMCPSFQASGEELHSTRGRANLLRAMFSGRLPAADIENWQVLYEALDLCLACKGCKSECPSGVDLAKLKYEFLQQYYQTIRRHHLRDYLFAYIDRLARLGTFTAPLSNHLLDWIQGGMIGGKVLQLASERRLPRLARRSLHSHELRSRQRPGEIPFDETVFLLSDAFTEYFEPEVGLSALRVLREAGCWPIWLPIIGAGRTLISKGFLKQARKHAARVVEAISNLDPEGIIPVVGIEPSEIYTLRDEYVDLLPGDSAAQALATRAWMIDEFLVRAGGDGTPRYLRIATKPNSVNYTNTPISIHGHCYQKAQPPAEDGFPVGVEATLTLLKAVGYTLETIQAGCCGMAGAFGYEAEHYDLSMKVGELALFPAVRRAGESVTIAAAGVSCRAQIEDGTGRKVVHPIQLVEKMCLGEQAVR